VVFYRIKNIKLKNGTRRSYLYLVKSIWNPTKHQSEQKVIAYLGTTNHDSYKAKDIWERDAYRCVKCERIQKLTIDHIIPLSKGGTNHESNLQTLCQICNKKKGKQILINPTEKQQGTMPQKQMEEEFPY